LIVQGDLTRADGHAERRAALDMIHRHSPGSTRLLTLAADKALDTADFVADLRAVWVTPHVAWKARHFAIDGRTTRHGGYALSIRNRKRIEKAFVWAKTVGRMPQTLYRGVERGRARFILTVAVNNLARHPNCWLPEAGRPGQAAMWPGVDGTADQTASPFGRKPVL